MAISIVLFTSLLLSNCSIVVVTPSGGSGTTNDTIHDTIFVSIGNGDDNNDGYSLLSPVKSLVKALQIANGIDPKTKVEIKVSVGVYTPNNGLNISGSGIEIKRHNIVISGGWNNSFTFLTGKSELDGNLDLYHVISIESVTNVTLKNLVIRRGKANGLSTSENYGGGIYATNVQYLTLEDCVISNNYSYYDGGGIYFEYSGNVTISNSEVSSNIADPANNGYGGGICLNYSHYFTVGGNIYLNKAYNGGGIYLNYSSNFTISSGSEVYTNEASYRGGGAYLYYSDYFVNSGTIRSNKAGDTGGGIYAVGNYSHSDFGTVTANTPNNVVNP